MVDTLTDSFCERCGTRYTFEARAARSGALSGVRVLGKGLRKLALTRASSLDEALESARADDERAMAARQLEAFHDTFHLCLSCRQYTCSECWNEPAGACLTCAPTPESEAAALAAGESAAATGADDLGSETAEPVAAFSPGQAPATTDWPMAAELGPDLPAGLPPTEPEVRRDAFDWAVEAAASRFEPEHRIEARESELAEQPTAAAPAESVDSVDGPDLRAEVAAPDTRRFDAAEAGEPVADLAAQAVAAARAAVEVQAAIATRAAEVARSRRDDDLPTPRAASPLSSDTGGVRRRTARQPAAEPLVSAAAEAAQRLSDEQVPEPFPHDVGRAGEPAMPATEVLTALTPGMSLDDAIAAYEASQAAADPTMGTPSEALLTVPSLPDAAPLGPAAVGFVEANTVEVEAGPADGAAEVAATDAEADTAAPADSAPEPLLAAEEECAPPALVEPAVAAGTAEPAVAEPAMAEAAAEPSADEPALVRSIEPAAAEPAVAEPAMAEAAAEPSADEPALVASAEPEPAIAEPSADEPALVASAEPGPATAEALGELPEQEPAIDRPRAPTHPTFATPQVPVSHPELEDPRLAAWRIVAPSTPVNGPAAEREAPAPLVAAALTSQAASRSALSKTVTAAHSGGVGTITQQRPAVPVAHACVGCGLSLSASARFCRRCGTRQP